MTGDVFPLFAEHLIKHIITKCKSILFLLDNHQSDFKRRHSGPSHSLSSSKKQHRHRVRSMWFSYIKTFLYFGPKRPSSEVAQLGREWFREHSIEATATHHTHYTQTKDILSIFGDITCEDLHTQLLRRIYNISLTHSLTHGAEPFLGSCQLCSYSRTSQHFMEPGGSLPCSQEPSNIQHMCIQNNLKKSLKLFHHNNSCTL
jgi:hypothetical protein